MHIPRLNLPSPLVVSGKAPGRADRTDAPFELAPFETAELGRGGFPGPLRSGAEAARFVQGFEAQLGLSDKVLAERKKLLSESPTMFYRMTPALFHQDMRGPYADALAGLSTRKAPQVTIAGDCHLGNFGVVRSENGKPIWSLNDFDNAGKGSPALDLVRLATSVLLVADECNLDGRECVGKALTSYLKRLDKGCSGQTGLTADEAHGPVQDVLKKAGKKTQADLLHKFAELTETGGYRLLRNDELVEPTGAERDRVQTLLKPRTDVLDVAVKKKSGGSTRGLERYYVLAKTKELPIILEVKQLLPNATESASGDPDLAKGETGFRASQRLGAPKSSTTYLAEAPGQAFLVREREREKAAVEWEDGLSQADLHSLAGQAGKVLGEAHSGAAKSILEWVGKDRDGFVERLSEVAEVYCRQVKEDFSSL